MNHPDWFSTGIRQGLQMLVVLSLRGTPQPDTMEFTAEVWEGAVWDKQAMWDKDADAKRIRAGFALLAQTVDRWPAPKNLLDAMPPRPDLFKLDLPPVSPEQRERNRQHIKALVEQFVKKARVLT